MSHRAETQAERVGRNDAIFRDANEGIRAAAGEYGLEEAVPFICECADPACTEIVRLELREYERVRKQPTRFINAIGHDRAAQQHARVVDRRDGYDIVEKVGEAAETAAELDPRSE